MSVPNPLRQIPCHAATEVEGQSAASPRPSEPGFCVGTATKLQILFLFHRQKMKKVTKIRSRMSTIKKIPLSQALLSVFAWIGKA